MIKRVTIENRITSRTIDLKDPTTSGFAIVGITGLNPSKSNINTSNTALSDGSVFNVARTEERNIVLQLVFQPGRIRLPGREPEWVTVEELRYYSYELFPNKEKITLKFENDNGLYAIDGYVESNEVNIFTKLESCSISVICPDPYFREVTELDEKIFKFSSTDPEFEFEFSNESLTQKLIKLGDIKQLSLANILYKGTLTTGTRIVLNFTGPVRNIKIFNITTSELLTINNSFDNNDSLEISSVVNNKRITLRHGSTKTNLIGSLDLMSDWINLQPGDNVVGYQAEEGDEHIEMIVYFHEYCLAI